MYRLVAALLFSAMAMQCQEFVRQYTIGTLPVNPAAGTVAVITNGSTPGDCVAGGGSFPVVCQYSGTSWMYESAIPTNTFDPFGAAATALTSAEVYASNASNLSSGIVSNLVLPANVVAFGAKGDGSHDDSTAIQNALNAGPGTVSFPPGTYKACSTLTTHQGVYIVSQGATLIPCSASQLQIQLTFISPTMAHAGISGLTFSGNGLDNITGLYCTYCQDFRLQNNTFIGMSPFVFDRGGQAVFIDDNLNKGDLVSHGAGPALMTSTTDTEYIFGLELNGYTVHNTGNGVSQTPLYFRRAVGSNISHVNVNDAHTGPQAQYSVLFENDSQGDRLTDSIFGAGLAAVLVRVGVGVNVAPSFLTIANVDADQQTTAGIDVDAGNYISIQGGKVTASGAALSASGVLFNSGTNLQVINMQFNGFTSGAGVNLGAVNQVTIRDSLFQNDGVGVGFASQTVATTVSGNQFSGVTTPIAGNPYNNGNWIHDNLGTISPGNLASSFPLSGSPFTYDAAYSVRYVIAGSGTLTSVGINGVTFGAAATSILQPGDVITLTYTGSLNWVWMPLH